MPKRTVRMNLKRFLGDKETGYFLVKGIVVSREICERNLEHLFPHLKLDPGKSRMVEISIEFVKRKGGKK